MARSEAAKKEETKQGLRRQGGAKRDMRPGGHGRHSIAQDAKGKPEIGDIELVYLKDIFGISNLRLIDCPVSPAR